MLPVEVQYIVDSARYTFLPFDLFFVGSSVELMMAKTIDMLLVLKAPVKFVRLVSALLPLSGGPRKSLQVDYCGFRGILSGQVLHIEHERAGFFDQGTYRVHHSGAV